MHKEIAILFFFCLLSLKVVYSQGLINNGAVIILNNGPHIYIDGDADGDFSNSSGGYVEVTTAGTITLEGDLSNSVAAGLFSNYATGTDPSTVVFKGTTAQNINGPNGINFSNVVLDNSSGIATGVTLNIKSNIYTSLTLTNGVLNTVAVLSIRDGATTTIGNAGSYIDGAVTYEMALSGTRTLYLPLGKGADWRPVELTPTHAAATAYFYTAELFNADAQGLGFTLPGTFTHVSYVHYYTITRSSAANFTNATIRLYYSNANGFNDGVTDPADLGIAKDNGSGAWVDITSGGGSAVNTGNILSASYSPQDTYYTLANKIGGTNPLPITLLNFDGECIDEQKKIWWTTASETNNSFFSVERSFNGIDYITIATIPGAGNSSTTQHYIFADTTTNVTQTIYYRLKQPDFNGNSETLPAITVTCHKLNNIASLSIFPNPSDGLINLFFSGMKDQRTRLTITDVLGRELLTEMIFVSDDMYTTKINLQNDIPVGTYFITAKNDLYQFTQKFIIH